jgi:hypothetical protein
VRIDPEDPARLLDGVRPGNAARSARAESTTVGRGEPRRAPADALSLSQPAQEFARLLERLRALPAAVGPERQARLEALAREPGGADSEAIAAALLRDEAVAAFLGFRPDR